MKKLISAELAELGIKENWHNARNKEKEMRIGRFKIVKRAHNEWEVTCKGKLMDSFSRQKDAIAYAKALSLR